MAKFAVGAIVKHKSGDIKGVIDGVTHWMPMTLPEAPKQACKHEFVYGYHSYGRKSGYQCRFCGKLQQEA